MDPIQGPEAGVAADEAALRHGFRGRGSASFSLVLLGPPWSHPMRTTIFTAACLAILATSGHAQAGGFTPGDLYLANHALHGPGADDGGIVRIDLAAGLATEHTPVDRFHARPGQLVWDPYRKRLLSFMSQAGTDLPLSVHMIDGAGDWERLEGFDNLTISGLTARGDGQIYVWDMADAVAPIKRIDAANRVHDLRDDLGAAPWFIPSISPAARVDLHYDAATNALFYAESGLYGLPCTPGVGIPIAVRRIPLSADGTRVEGAIDCTQFDVSPLSNYEAVAAIGPGPAGSIQLTIDTTSNKQEPRVLLLDPVTMSLSPYASPGPFVGSGTLSAGVYVDALDKVLVLDSFTNVLRAFGSGETGEGATVPLTGTVSYFSSVGELATLEPITDDGCSGGWQARGLGLAGAGDHVPALWGIGCPRPGSVTTAHVEDVVGGAMGYLLFGMIDAEVPFRGGTLYVSPVDIAILVTADGAPGVAGDGGVDVLASWPSDPSLTGMAVYMQAGFYDAAATQGFALTQGLRIELG